MVLSEAFDTISKNIESIKTKHPVFFKNNVSFLTVLHNENDIQKVLKYFNEKYDKTPKLGSLVTNFLDKNHEDEFFQIYKNVDKILKTENVNKKTPYIKGLTLETVSSFIRGYLRNEFSDYRHLLTNQEHYSKTPTGTCDVFSTEMYLSPDAKIYACAGTQPEDYLGYIKDNEVIMNLEEVRTFYNTIYHNISKQCEQCYLLEMCPLCIFKLQDKTNPICQYFTGATKISPFFEHFLNYFEKTKGAYHNNLKNRIIQKYQHKQVERLDV